MEVEPVALIFQSKISLVKGFTEFVIKLINKKKGTFSIAFSGGSSPKTWFDFIAENYAYLIPWERLQLYWGDERCVPPDDPESNFGMTKKHLLKKIKIPEKNIHRIPGELEPVQAVDQYEKKLQDNLGEIPIFDLIILGVGEDGHTASIFPHQIKLWDSDRLCVVASHPISGQKRVSFTGKVINNASAVAFLVTGEKKAGRIKEIIDEEPNAVYYPASLVKPIKGTLQWFLDKDAAKLIRS